MEFVGKDNFLYRHHVLFDRVASLLRKRPWFLRMLRASKNRFGSSDEVGVYEMSESRQMGGRLLPVD